MATETWLWARTEVARLFARRDGGREQEEIERLDGFADDLSTAAERDVHNRLFGYLEARLSDEVVLRNDFLVLVRRICTELGLDPPTNPTHQQVIANNSVVVQTAGGPAQVTVSVPPVAVVRWAAMTGPEAARKLESMELTDAVEALTDMESTLAARRLAHVVADQAAHLLSHMDEAFAAELLSKMVVPARAAELLGLIEPAGAAAILDTAGADWAVARLAEMDPDRALVLLATMGTKRTEDLLDAMERQQTVRLLSAVGRVLSDQARARTTFDLARREAERIAAQARELAEETIHRAQAEAQAITKAARRGAGVVDDAADEAALPTVETPVAVSPEIHPPALPPAVSDPEPRPPVVCSLPAELFLVGHDPEGRARIDQDVLETAVAGALLCDLIRAGVVGVTDGYIALSAASSSNGSIAGAPIVDPVAAYAVASLAGADPEPIAWWLRRARKDVFVRLVQRLTDSGAIVPVAKAWSAFRSGISYRPASDVAAAEPAARIVRHLLNPAEAADESTYLLASLMSISQLHEALPIKLRSKQVRQLLHQRVQAINLGPDLVAGINGVDAAIAAIAMAPRRS